MHTRKLIGLVISTSLVSTGLIAVPVSAEVNNSDITGTNVWNNTAPIFEGDGELDPEILNNARRLDQALERASENCCNAAAPEPVGPRRYARNPGNNNNEVCVNPECQRLSGLVEETQVFLNDVNRQVEEVRTTSASRTW
jgi:hypothetical protein